MIIGTGIDTVEVARFQRFLDENNQRLLDRLFTPQEQEYCRAKKQAAACFAARFAAKEAFLKAMGTGLRDGMRWIEIEVVNNPLGKPELYLSGCAAQMLVQHGARRSLLSLSHDGGQAVAIVILE